MKRHTYSAENCLLFKHFSYLRNIAAIPACGRQAVMKFSVYMKDCLSVSKITQKIVA